MCLKTHAITSHHLNIHSVYTVTASAFRCDSDLGGFQWEIDARGRQKEISLSNFISVCAVADWLVQSQ